MQKKELVRMLIEAGYTHQRNGHKHEIWKNGERCIIMSRGSKMPPHLGSAIRSQIRRHQRASLLAVTKIKAPLSKEVKEDHESAR